MTTARGKWTPAQMVEVLSAHVYDAGGIRGWCETHDRKFSVAFISDVLRGRRDMTERLATALGFAREPQFYRRVKP